MSLASPEDVKLFRKALGTFTTGVTIVTTRDRSGADVGLTANSFNSVSLDPPMVLWSLGKNSTNLDAFKEADHFVVHILATDQDQMSTLFAKTGADKFSGMTVGRGPGNVPLIEGCTARFQCGARFQYEGGDHIIFVGEVLTFDHSDRPPLVFHGGRYGMVVRKVEDKPLDQPFAAEPDGVFNEGFLGYLVSRAHYQLFVPVRRELERRGLSRLDFLILTALTQEEGLTLARLVAVLDYTGIRPNPAEMKALTSRGLTRAEGATPDEPHYFLTDAGRQLLIELMVVAKAAEAEVEPHLDHSEMVLLKDLLRRLSHSISGAGSTQS